MHPRDLGPYALQLRRLLVLACVLAAICITLLSGPQLLPSSASTIDLAQWVVYSPNLILPLVAGACAGFAAVRSIATRRREHTPADTAWFLIVRIYLGCYLALIVACALLPAVNLSSPVPPVYFEAIVSDTNPILALYPLASFICVAVLRGRDTAVYLTAIAPLQVLAMMAADPSIKLSDAIMGPIYFLLVAMVNAGMLHWTLTIAYGLDRTQRSAREAERALAVERARGHARARSNGLIHDYVLAALILAITRGVDEAEVRAAADAALSALVPAPPSDGTVDAAQVRGALAALVGPRRPHWTFECRLPKDGWNIPAQVASALAGATHEALNNVRLHAGADTSDPSAPARCRVTLTAGGDFVRVTIIDAGRGFDATRLSEGRHGVRESIVNRMESVGGRATLTSRPGGGTRVILEWIDPHKRWLRPREAIRTALTRRQRGAGVGAKDQSRIAWDSQVRAAAESRGARALVLAGIAVHACILTVEISHGAYSHVAPPVLALALIAVAGASLVARWADRVPPAVVTWGSAAAIGAANLLVLPLVRGPSQWPGWSGWSAGASMFLAALLLVRQRQAEAIAGCAAFVAAVAAWVAIQGRTPLLVFTFTIGHILTFMLWFGLVKWSGSATSSIERSLKDEGQARLERELQVATNTAMAVELADVSVRARGTLQAIRDRELTPELSMKALLLEAELRDEIRAPFFTGTEVVAAARRARSRGVEVVLFDDRGDATRGGSTEYEERLRTRIVERAVAALDEAGAGRVVVRACPAGRRWAATILTDAGLDVVESKAASTSVC
mgnify:FL=1